MKALFFSTVLTTLSLTLFAQNKSSGVGIHYTLVLLENDDTRDIVYSYEPGTASMFTALYPPEMKLYQDAFLKHVETMRSVKNYVGPMGTSSPTSMGDRGFQEAIIKIGNGKLERVGRMYMEVSQYEDMYQYKSDTIFLNDEPRVAGDVLLLGNDTIYTENISTGEIEERVEESTHSFHEYAASAGFIEEWHFDHRKGSLEKEIKYLSLSHQELDQEENTIRGFSPIMTFKSGKFNKKYINENSLIRENVEYNVLFNRDFSREDEDIHYYGMARASEAYGYIEPIERIQFLISILHNVKQGSLDVYEYNPVNFDINDLKKVHNISWFDDVKWNDTVFRENILTGEMDTVIVEGEYKLDDVVGIRFFEDWYMDSAHFALYKRVKGIVVLREAIDPQTGVPKGVTPISSYYIKLNPQR